VEDEQVEQVSCSSCDTEIPVDDSLTISNGELVCGDCYHSCWRCEWSGTESDDWYYVEDNRWCNDCYSDNAFTCERCDYTYDNNRTSQYEIDGSDWWCEHCTSDNANFCENCEVYHTERECYNCEGDESTGIIHNYSYKPNPIFNGKSSDNLFMGFELEIELNALDSRALSSAVSEVEDYTYGL